MLEKIIKHKLCTAKFANRNKNLLAVTKKKALSQSELAPSFLFLNPQSCQQRMPLITAMATAAKS